MNDQASRLREMANCIDETFEEIDEKSAEIYSVVSGKGGVGKTNLAINLAIKLQEKGKKVLILDGDIGMNNANILLGIGAVKSLSQVIDGSSSFKDIIIKGPEGVDLISGGAELFLIESLGKLEQETIIKSLEKLGDYDIILIDNGAGINKHSLTFSSFADEIILVTTPEPTALTDAYRVLKASSLYKVKMSAFVVINQVIDDLQGEESFTKLKNVCKKFLNIDLESLGYIFNDVRVNKSIMEQVPLVISYPKSLASENIDDIANKLLGLEVLARNNDSSKKLSNRLIKFFG